MPLEGALVTVEDARYHRYFRLLKDQYSETAFARDAIRECATYRDSPASK